MITTDTGAKKIENSDNWRLIFDAHNDSVDAEDKIVPEMAPIVNGNKSTVGAAIGEYVLVRNSSITGITDGAYTAAKAIPANTTIDSTYLTAVGTGGALNSLNSKMNRVELFSSSGTESGNIQLNEAWNNFKKLIIRTKNGGDYIDHVIFCDSTTLYGNIITNVIVPTANPSGNLYRSMIIITTQSDKTKWSIASYNSDNNYKMSITKIYGEYI